jgi:hypothetical protein
MDGLGEPRDQPIGMPPMIAHLIDERRLARHRQSGLTR